MPKITRPEEDASAWQCRHCGDIVHGIQDAVKHAKEKHNIESPRKHLSGHFVLLAKSNGRYK